MPKHGFRSFSRRRTLLVLVSSSSALLIAQLVVPSSASAGLSYVGMMHTSGVYGLHGPRAVTEDNQGDVFVADSGANRIVEFDSQGNGVRAFGQGDNMHIGQAGHLYNPTQLVWSPVNGDLYVTDSGANEVQEFTTTGAFVRKWGSAGSGDGQFSLPIGITVDCAGNVYVTNAQNPWDIEEFTDTGTFVKRFGAGHAGVPTGIVVTSYSTTSCTQPDAIVSDEYDAFLTMYDSTGKYLRNIGTNGHGPLQFERPEQLSTVTDGSGTHVWVADSNGPRAEEITTNNQGTSWAFTMQLTHGAQQFSDTSGVWVDAKGAVFAANVETTEIDEFKNAAPTLLFHQVHATRNHISSAKAMDFVVGYNQTGQACRSLISAKVTVPPHAAHVFTLTKNVTVPDTLIGVTLPLTARQEGWLHTAWSAGNKVAIAAKAAGCSDTGVVISTGLKFSV